MILRILAVTWLLSTATSQVSIKAPPEPDACLTGQMKNVLQSWTDDFGVITAGTDWGASRTVIDLSSIHNPTTLLAQSLWKDNRGEGKSEGVRFLSLARCQLTSVPQVFNYKDRAGRSLASTLEYMTFLGNQFHVQNLRPRYYVAMNATGATELSFGNSIFDNKVKATWDIGFRNISFPNLLELDLRSCSIQHLTDGTFKGMPSLSSLYLGENKITYISSHAFAKLTSLIHLDLSQNTAAKQDGKRGVLKWESEDVLSHLTNLRSLDLSRTLLSQNSVEVFQNLGMKFQRLSVCSSGLNKLRPNNFMGTNLKYLDLSGNTGLIDDPRSLNGLQESLKVLYADSVGLKSLESLEGFKELEVLKLSRNEISVINQVVETWQNLQILDLDFNRLNSWVENLFSKATNLKILSIRNNNINLIKPQMLEDLRNISYIALSGNFFVCSCFSREFFEIAANNDLNDDSVIFNSSTSNDVISFQVGFYDYYSQINSRKVVKRACSYKEKPCKYEVNEELNGNFRLFDYDDHNYDCFYIDEGFTLSFAEVDSCNMIRREILYDEYIWSERRKIIIIATVATVGIPVLVLMFIFRRSFMYFCITVKNSATLSLMAESKGYDDGSIFNYDVFVSYCNEDRPWVLDQLLPHVENDCNVSVCLHERDFQVGLSILENIVSCMDRSRSIMLVISQRFLLSQWCQFEMHLAQHRLLETRREDLILILLEDIPRRLRPNTLHYLMLTKTYVLWPKDPAGQAVFWRRLKKSLVMQKLKQSDNVSLA